MKRVLRSLVLWCVRLVGWVNAFRTTRRKSTGEGNVRRILLVRPDHLGDLVLTSPVLTGLKAHAPDVSITMMVGPWSSEVVARHPALDHLLTYPFPGFRRTTQGPTSPYLQLLRCAQQIRRGKYDLAINLRPDFWWGAAMLYLAQVPQRVGYAIEPGTPFLTHALPFQSEEHATVSALRLGSEALRLAGYPSFDEPYTPERYPLQFEPTQEERGWVDDQLAAMGIQSGDPVIVIHPGTGAPVKLWRTDGWVRCAQFLTTTRLLAAQPRIVLTGSRQERSLLEAISSRMDTALPMYTEMTVGQLAAMLRRAQLVLGVDSGPLHLATAQTTPSLRLFGPTDPRIFGPWGNTRAHRVIASTYRCPTCPAIPCGRLDFSPQEVENHPCVRMIQEEHVLKAVTLLLQSDARSESAQHGGTARNNFEQW